MKNIFGSTGVCGMGYHFSRFRRKDWRRLYVQDLWKFPEERAEAGRRLKLKGLYYMGVLLMFVGFLICFNAVFRTPPSGKRQAISRSEPAPVVYAGTGESNGSPEFTTVRGKGNGRTGNE
ncbi:MAG: hypothetical protein LBS53_03600 [Synergistaceae bacterium]|jgi:hypothetical protein|nr:hypothetical protein [Synergistaceae bacterium]